MINTVALTGRLTRDPELRYTSSNKPVASFKLAVNRQYTNSNGEREADFIDCVIWRGAEALANNTSKGSLIGVEGRLQTRSYENQQGTRVFVTEVVCSSFSFLETKAENQQKNNTGISGYSDKPTEKTNKPAANKNADPFADSKPIDISDSDLPF